MAWLLKRPFILLGLFSLAGLLSYSGILDSFFVSDDFVLIHAIREKGPGALWFHGGVFLRPVISLSLAADLMLWDLSAVGYHIHNVLIHTLNAIAVLYVALGIGRRLECQGVFNWRRVGFIAALIFLTSPSHTEAVSWISGRTDLYATLFTLTALGLYLQFESGPGRRVVAPLMYALALLSKESAAALPLLIFVLEIWPQPSTLSWSWRKRCTLGLRCCLPFLAVFGLYVLGRWIVLDHAFRGPGHAFPGPRLLTETIIIHAAKSILAYWPMGLMPFRNILREYGLVIVVVGLGVAGGIWSVLQHSTSPRRLKVPLFSLTAWLILLLPALYLPTRLFTMESDRFLYLPSVFVAFGLAAMIEQFMTGPRTRVLASSLLVVINLVLLQRANVNWRWAGETSRHIISSIVRDPDPRQIVAISVPDNLRGAYVFRNGLSSAIALFSPPGSRPNVSVLTTFEMLHRSDSITVTRVGSSYQARLNRPSSRFEYKGPPAPSCVRILPKDGPSPWIRIENRCGPDVRLMVFHNGSLVALDSATLALARR